jgi:hypothetical protein
MIPSLPLRGTREPRYNVSHAADFDAPIYNIWKQQEKTMLWTFGID